MKKYTKEELISLQTELYDILNEIIRICNKFEIPYFAIGGTAIGALYDQAILPWDDDIDIGMTRETILLPNMKERTPRLLEHMNPRL